MECMKRNLLYTIALTLYSSCMLGMTTNFFKPTTHVPKIRFANDTYFTVQPGYFRSAAKQSYGLHGIKGYTFQWNKPEVMLNSFTDENLAKSDTTSAGRAYIDGTVINHEFSFVCTKNIPRGFFFDVQIYQRNLVLKNINLVPLNSKFEPFGSDESFQNEDVTFYNYVTDFKNKYTLFQGKERQTYSLNQTFFLAGYTKTWNHFNRIDFVDFSFKGGFTFNFNNIKNKSILALPIHNNNGFCAEAASSIGIYTWLNFGAALSGKVYTSNQQQLKLNTNSIDNDFLKPEVGFAKIKQYPFISGCFYIEADHFVAGLSMLLGYSYTYQGKSKIDTGNNTTFKSIDNSTPDRYKSWKSGTLLFDIEYDFATEKNRNAPFIKLSFHKTIHGRNVMKSAAQAISCCLQFSKRF